MSNSDIFDDSKPKKSHIPKFKIKKPKLKGYHIAIILISISIPVGILVLPYFDDYSGNDIILVPIDMSDKDILFENTDTEVKLIEVNDQPSEEKPLDIKNHDFIGTKERVTLTRDNQPIFWFIVATEGQWQGDFSDIVKKPTTIKKEGYIEIQFRCFEEDGEMKYFGNFRNLEGKPINVAVLKAKEIIDEKRVDINKAIIMEGNC